MTPTFVLAKVKLMPTLLGTMKTTYYYKEPTLNGGLVISTNLRDAKIFEGFGSAMAWIAKYELHEFEIFPLTPA